ncbi:MAG TPA: HD domain-containing phosphohydrolase [Solirubrobacteraceae bacterium]
MSIPSAVSGYAAGIASVLGLSGAELESMRLVAVLHDIGKVTVPDRILRKAGPLTPEEFVVVAEHPIAGARTLRRIEGMEEIAECVLRSHEHYDGSGYPDGMAGASIPFQSRILLVADAYDAMTSDRPYRSALEHEQAMAELRDLAGAQFDPDCVAALATYLDDRVMPSGETAA